jgi:hypothetical protein
VCSEAAEASRLLSGLAGKAVAVAVAMTPNSALAAEEEKGAEARIKNKKKNMAKNSSETK